MVDPKNERKWHKAQVREQEAKQEVKEAKAYYENLKKTHGDALTPELKEEAKNRFIEAKRSYNKSKRLTAKYAVLAAKDVEGGAQTSRRSRASRRSRRRDGSGVHSGQYLQAGSDMDGATSVRSGRRRESPSQRRRAHHRSARKSRGRATKENSKKRIEEFIEDEHLAMRDLYDQHVLPPRPELKTSTELAAFGIKADNLLCDFFTTALNYNDNVASLSTEYIYIVIQRLLEAWLMIQTEPLINEFNLRPPRWDNPQYYMGPEIEELHHIHIVKAPKYTFFDDVLYRQDMALETGSCSLSDKEWTLMAYEQLLCCYNVFYSKMVDLEILDMAHRDIARISIEKYCQSMNEAGFVDNKGTDCMRDIDDAVPQLICEVTFQLVRDVLLASKTTFNIIGSENEIIGSLTIPNGSEGFSFGQYKEIFPTDVRYRVCRMLELWISHEEKNKLTDFTNPSNVVELCEVTQKWIYRQIHYLHINISQKLLRLIRFLPVDLGDGQPKETFLRWTTEDPVQGVWNRVGHLSLPTFNVADNPALNQYLNRFRKVIDYCLGVLTALGRAVSQALWSVTLVSQNINTILGVREISVVPCDLLRSVDGLETLLMGMTNMSYLDGKIRELIGTREAIDKDVVLEPETKSDDNLDAFAEGPWSGYCVLKSELVTAYEAYLASETYFGTMDPYWSLEPSVLMTFLAYIWRCITDPNQPDKRKLNHKDLIYGIMMITHLSQFGENIVEDQATNCYLPITQETHGLLGCVAIGWAAIHGPPPTAIDDIDKQIEDLLNEDDQDFDNKVADCQLNPSILSAMLEILNLPTYLQKKKNLMWPGFEAHSCVELESARMETFCCIYSIVPENIITIYKELGKEKPTDNFTTNLFKTPDWCVCTETANTDTYCNGVARELTNIAIREYPEGLSLTTPSRIERAVTMIQMHRSLSLRLRRSFVKFLNSYRVYFEPITLNYALTFYFQFNSLMFLGSGAKYPDLNSLVCSPDFYEPAQGIPSWLSSPREIATYPDLFKHFIANSCRNLAVKFFGQIDRRLGEPIDSDGLENSTLVADFGQYLAQFNDELLGEIEFFAPIWSNFLPNNQHIIIVFYTGRRYINDMIYRLRSSPYWPTDMPPGGDVLYKAVADFDRLCTEVAFCVIPDIKQELLEPSLYVYIKDDVYRALNSRLTSFESLMITCICSDTFEATDPQGGLYFSQCITDFFSFFYRVLDFICSFDTPVTWVFQAFLLFVSRLIVVFFDHSTESLTWPDKDVTPEKLFYYVEHCFVNCTQPYLIESYLNIANFDSKGKDKKKGFFKLRKKGVKPKTFLESIQKMNINGDLDRKGGSRQNKAYLATLDHMANPNLPHEISLILILVKDQLAEMPLMSYLTRLTNAQYCCEALSPLIERLIERAHERARKRHSQAEQIYKIFQDIGVDNFSYNIKRTSFQEASEMFNHWFQLDQQELEPLEMETARRLGTWVQKIQEHAKNKILLCTAQRIIFQEFYEDLFMELYQGGNEAESNLARVLRGLPVTIFKFMGNMANGAHKECFLNHVIRYLCYAWVFYLVQIGFNGYPFTPSFLAVIESDLEALDAYILVHGVEDEAMIQVHNDKAKRSILTRMAQTEKAPQNFNLIEHIKGFINLLQENPEVMLVGSKATDQSPTNENA